jgi:hypothetical protein
MVCVLYIYIFISIPRLCHIVICLTRFLQVCQVDSDAGLVVDAQTNSSAPIAELDCSHLANGEEVMGVLVIWGDPLAWRFCWCYFKDSCQGHPSIAHAGPAGVFSDPLYECQITIKAPETIDVHAVNMGVWVSLESYHKRVVTNNWLESGFVWAQFQNGMVI